MATSDIQVQLCYHRLRGSGSTVVMMTSRVNGTMEISTSCKSETSKNIETKIGQNNYVMGPFNLANFHRNQSKVVRSPYSWNITLNCVIPSLPFPSLLLVVTCIKNGWTDFLDLYLKRCGFTEGCAFWGFRWEKIVQGIKTPYNPQKVGMVRLFQAKRKKKLNFQYLRNNKSEQYEIWQDT